MPLDWDFNQRNEDDIKRKKIDNARKLDTKIIHFGIH